MSSHDQNLHSCMTPLITTITTSPGLPHVCLFARHFFSASEWDADSYEDLSSRLLLQAPFFFVLFFSSSGNDSDGTQSAGSRLVREDFVLMRRRTLAGSFRGCFFECLQVGKFFLFKIKLYYFVFPLCKSCFLCIFN